MKSLFSILKTTTWPKMKQNNIDFGNIVEYIIIITITLALLDLAIKNLLPLILN